MSSYFQKYLTILFFLCLFPRECSIPVSKCLYVTFRHYVKIYEEMKCPVDLLQSADISPFEGTVYII